MKKVIAILLAVVLVVGGLGAFAYAQGTHEPMKGDKLIGIGSLGSKFLHAEIYNGFWTGFSLTNPDGVSEITIERISIIRGDSTVIYEGPLLHQKVVDNEVVESIPITTLKPHEIHHISLQWYMPDPDDLDHEWMNGFSEARLLPLVGYTVEIFWTAPKKGLLLIGWAYQQHGFLNAEGVPLMSEEGIYVGVVTGFGTPMVNMEQEFEPED